MKSKKRDAFLRNQKETNDRQSIKKTFEYNYYIKRTSKLKYNFNLNAIVFNQRLAFDLNPQLHIEDYLISIQLNAHSVRFCFDNGLINQIANAKSKLPSIIFRCDPLERWIQFDKTET